LLSYATAKTDKKSKVRDGAEGTREGVKGDGKGGEDVPDGAIWQGKVFR